MLIKISGITVNPGRRETAKQRVEELAASIQELGLLNPITLDRQHTLIAGLHRLEAAKLLGWTEIECTVVSLEGIRASLAEIDENVVRHNLSNLEQAEALLRRKELYEALHPETKNGGDKNASPARTQNLRSGHAKPFTQDTAEKLGISRRAVEVQVQVARNLTPKAKEILRQSGINIGKTDALNLSKLPPEQQAEAAHLYASGQIHSISEYPLAGQAVPPEQHPDQTDSRGTTPVPVEDGGHSATIAESVAQLKDHNKDCGCTPDMLLDGLQMLVSGFCKSMEAYTDAYYADVFPALSAEQISNLKQQMNRITAATDEFYQYVKGVNHYA